MFPRRVVAHSSATDVMAENRSCQQRVVKIALPKTSQISDYTYGGSPWYFFLATLSSSRSLGHRRHTYRAKSLPHIGGLERHICGAAEMPRPKSMPQWADTEGDNTRGGEVFAEALSTSWRWWHSD